MHALKTQRVKTVAGVAAAVLPFINALGNGFTVDDAYLVLGNRDIRSLSNLGSFFVTAWGGSIDSQFYGAMNAGYYRPLSMTLYAFEYKFFGYVPALWRALSVALHALISLLTYAIARRLAADTSTANDAGRSKNEADGSSALVAALIFAVHPVHSEVLNPATYQTTLLATLAVLCAFRLHLQPFSFTRACLIALALAAGILSKESALSAPLLLPLYDLLLRPNRERRRYHLPTYLLSAGVCIAYLAVRFSLLQSGGYSFFGEAPARFIVPTMLKVVVLYGQLLLFPLLLCPFYDWYLVPPTDSLLDPGALGGLVVLVLLCPVAFVLWRRGRGTALFALAWVVVALLPVSQVVPLLNVAAERFLYLPSVGFCLLLATFAQWDGRGKRSFLILLLTLFALRTAARNPDWRDDITLNLAFARDFPQTPTPHINLTRHYRKLGDRASALRHSQRARKLDPGLAGPWRDSVQLLNELGRTADARQLVREAEAAGIAIHAPPGDAGASQ